MVSDSANNVLAEAFGLRDPFKIINSSSYTNLSIQQRQEVLDFLHEAKESGVRNSIRVQSSRINDLLSRQGNLTNSERSELSYLTGQVMPNFQPTPTKAQTPAPVFKGSSINNIPKSKLSGGPIPPNSSSKSNQPYDVYQANTALSNSISNLQSLKSQGKLTAAQRVKLYGQEFAQQFTTQALSYGEILKTLGALPGSIRYFKRNPNEIKPFIKSIPGLEVSSAKAIYNVGKNFVSFARTNPDEGIIIAGANLIELSAESRILDEISELGKAGKLKIKAAVLDEAKAGKKIEVTTSSGKKVELKIVNKIPKESFAKQIARAGTKVNAVSAQAESLFSLLKDEKIIRKPIPNEELLNSATKRLLSKFDQGTITKKELGKLDRLIKNQKVKIGFGGKAKGLLERSFFADPEGRIRISRIIKQLKNKPQNATLLDIIRGKDLTFKVPKKPEIYVLPGKEVEGIPRSLKKIIEKIRQGKGGLLTDSEVSQYLQFQFKRTGKLKPIGFPTLEAEVTGSPRDILKRIKKLKPLKYQGEVIDIVEADIYKPTSKFKKLLKKAERGDITDKEIRSIKNTVKKENLAVDFDEKFVKANRAAQREYSKDLEIANKKIKSLREESAKQIKQGLNKDLSSSEKDILRKQAEHEVSLAESKLGKLSKSEREASVNKRFNKLKDERLRELTKKNNVKIKRDLLKEEKRIKEKIKSISKKVKKPSLESPSYSGRGKNLKYVNLKQLSVLSAAKALSRLPHSLSRKLSRSTSSNFRSSGRSPSRNGPRSPGKSPPRSPPKSPPRNGPRSPGKSPPRSPPKQPPRSPPRQPPRQPPHQPPKQPPYNADDYKLKIRSGKRVSSGYDVYARPLKASRKGLRPKLIKVNRVPLSKARAKDLRNYIADQSLARTSQIKKGSGTPINGKINVPIGYSKKTSYKFREFKIKNKRARSIPSGRVIEKSKYLLDTRSEKRGISLRKAIAEVNKPANRIKRKATPQQLKNLAKGREKLKRMRR